MRCGRTVASFHLADSGKSQTLRAHAHCTAHTSVYYKDMMLATQPCASLFLYATSTHASVLPSLGFCPHTQTRGTLCTVTASRRRNRCVGSNTSGSSSSAAAAPPSLGRLGPNPGHTAWEGTKICFLIVHTFMMIRCLERDKKTRTQNKEMLKRPSCTDH